METSSSLHQENAISEDVSYMETSYSHTSSWVLNSYRPRGSLARTLYAKQLSDNYLNTVDKSQWYQCDLCQLPQDVAERFVRLHADEDTCKFLQQSEDKSDWILTQIWHSLVKAFLGWFMTQTSINGWLRRGSMFVLSLPQFLNLIKKDESWRGGSLLDLGAGDGEVTARLATVFDKVYVTEVSSTMQALLQTKGYELLDVYDWHLQKFDVISCLNVLDRCDEPLQLLHHIKGALRGDGLVLIGVVLPFSSYVETGSPDHRPKEILPVAGDTFEEQVCSFIKDVFPLIGLEVISWSRVPYLCEGDLQQSFYWLDDAIFLLKIKDEIV